MDKKKLGRPCKYTKELAEEICDAIATSSKGIAKLSAENPHLPAKSTILYWRKIYPDFSDLYAQAKLLQVEALVDEILEIADDVSRDQVINEEGKKVVDHEHIQRSRLRIDTRKWLASKLVPKVYGDRIQNETTLEITSQEDALKALM